MQTASGSAWARAITTGIFPLQNAVKIGIAFEAQRVEHAAVDEHDQRLDAYVTEGYLQMEMTKLSCEISRRAGQQSPAGRRRNGGAGGCCRCSAGQYGGQPDHRQKKYAAVEADIQALNTKADALRKELEALVQADADAFAPLAAAYGLPRTHQSRLHTSRRAGKGAGCRLRRAT